MSNTSLAGKRILLLFPHMVAPGGALNYTLRLAEQLVKRGAVVGIVTMRHDPQSIVVPVGVEVLSAEGPLTSSLTYWGLFPFWQQKLASHIKNWEPDLLIPQVFPSNWWGWIYRQRNSVPLLWVCHEPSAFIHSSVWISALLPRWKGRVAAVAQPVLRSIDLQLSRSTDIVFANSRFTRSEVKRVYGLDAAGVAYPGIDESLYNCDNTPREESLVTVASLSRFKRVDFLLRVFSRLLKNHPSFVYHVVGKGDDEDSLRELAKKLGIADRVYFHGKIDVGDLASLHRRSLLFLHGTIAEPFGMAPLEAIACGTPVVAHNSGGPAEYIDDSTGRLIDSDSEDEWATQISRFIDDLKSDPGYFASVAERAKAFSWDSTLQPLIDCVLRVVHPRFSIVMPSFNQVAFLEEAVRSVLDQRGVDVELLVMDPGSTDGSRELLELLQKEYGGRLVLHFEPDRGQSDAVNRGMEMANGTVLGWLNSDDLLRPGTLAKVAGLLQMECPAWLYGQAGVIDKSGKPCSGLVVTYKNWRAAKFSRLKLLTENFIPQMSVFWNRAMWERAGGLDLSKHLDMDYDLWLRFAAVTAPTVLMDELADFRVHEGAKGSRQTGEQLDAAFSTAVEHASEMGLSGRMALIVHKVLSLRTRAVYWWLKP